MSIKVGNVCVMMSLLFLHFVLFQTGQALQAHLPAGFHIAESQTDGTGHVFLQTNVR